MPRLLGGLLLVLWPLELLRLVFGLPMLGGPGAALFLVYLLLALALPGLGNRLLSVLLLGGIATVIALDGAIEPFYAAVQSAMVFTAFLPAVFLLRHAMVSDRQLLRYRERLQAKADREQLGWMLVGAYVLGSTLTVGALAVLAPVLGADTPDRQRRRAAMACMFGISLSVLWSPVFVAMAVVSQFMAHVPLWKPMLIGVALGTLGLVGLLGVLGFPGGWRSPLAALGALRGILPLVAVTAGTTVLLVSVTSLTTMEAASLILLPLVAVILMRQDVGQRRGVVSATRASLERLGAELSVVAWAFVLGALMRRSETIQTLAQGLLGPETPALLLIALIVYGILGTVSIGGHPIVAASILLAVLGAGTAQLTDTVLFASVVLGWGCSSMIGPAALNLMMTSLMFQVSRRSLIVSVNTVLNLVFASMGIVCLAVINAWLRS